MIRETKRIVEAYRQHERDYKISSLNARISAKPKKNRKMFYRNQDGASKGQLFGFMDIVKVYFSVVLNGKIFLVRTVFLTVFFGCTFYAFNYSEKHIHNSVSKHSKKSFE